MAEQRSLDSGAHNFTTKKRVHAPKNLWSIPEVAPTLFLRSRRVRGRAIIIMLNERYAPTVRKIGAVSLKLRVTFSIHLWSGKCSGKALVRPRSETNLVSQCGNAVPSQKLLRDHCLTSVQEGAIFESSFVRIEIFCDVSPNRNNVLQRRVALLRQEYKGVLSFKEYLTKRNPRLSKCFKYALKLSGNGLSA